MAKLTYTNSRGESIELGRKTKFFVTNLDGFSNVNAIISSNKSFKQDGETITETTLDTRHLTIEGEFLYKEVQEGRDKLISVFNPKLDGKLEYSKGNIKRVINCRPESSPVIPSSKLATVPYMINLFAADPYWADYKVNSSEIVSWRGGLIFPLDLPTGFATKGAGEINIINSGDVATPVTFVIAGKATNPMISNRLTGEYIKVDRELTETDTMAITTGFGNKRVEQNGESVFNYIDLNSTFFDLSVGDNVIKMTTDNIEDEASLKITYTNRYIGV